MTVENTSTFEQAAPHRPAALMDILNGYKTNSSPTVPPTFVAGEEVNQIAALLEAVAKMVPLVRISIDFASGAPYIAEFCSVRSDITADDIDVNDLGTGVTEIVLPASTYPAPNGRPVACTNVGDADHIVDAVQIGTAVTVYTAVSTSGTLSDAAFTVMIF